MKKILISIIIIASLFLYFDNANGQSWFQQNSNTNNQLNSISTMLHHTAWICGDNGTVLKTSDGGDNWINVSGNGIPDSLKLINIFMHYFGYIDYVYVTGSDGSGSYIYMTTNYGLNWNNVLTVTGQGARINGIWFNETATGFAEGEPVAGRWSFWKSTNNGLTWDSAGLYFNGQNYTGFPNNLSGKVNVYGNFLYIGANYNGTEARIFHSTDIGTTWTELNPGISKKMTSISFVREDIGLIGGDNYVYCTTNSGINWNLTANLPYTPNFVGVITNTNLLHYSFYLKTDSVGSQTMYHSWNYGTHWWEDYSGINGIKHMQGYDFEIWAVGDSGKIYYEYVNYPYVKRIGNEVPEVFNLYQNYPNPFNPTTTIRFDIMRSSNVKLVVYNIQGKEIATLVNEKLNAGSYQVDWPAPTGDASGYPSGVYFYKLISDGFVDVKKMVLIK